MNRQHPRALRPPTLVRSAACAAALTAAVALGAVTPSASPSGTASAEGLTMASTSAMSSDTYESRVQRLVNVRRHEHGLTRLRFAACPDRTAERWSRFLAANDLFYHQSMTSVLDRCDARYAGETLGRGSMPPRRLVRMWMESPTHRAILLSAKPRRIGIGATRSASGGWVVAANFLRF